MPANPWELRADLVPLEVAATRWDEIAQLMARHGDDLVDAARRATEGWDAASADSYDQHSRLVLRHLDRFTTLARDMARSLRSVAVILTSSQEELDGAWAKVAMVPHQVVGESRYLVFTPDEDDDRGKVDYGRAETEDIRGRLAYDLDRESERLRRTREELGVVRTDLATLTGGAFPGFGTEVSGVGTIAPVAASTSVAGSAQAGVAYLPPIAPIDVSMPHLQGVSGSLAPIAALAAAGLRRRQAGAPAPTGTPPMGGMGAGAGGARAGSAGRGMAGGRAGSRPGVPRPTAPRPPSPDDPEARAAREAAKDAKRTALEERRAERAARKAERDADRDGERGAPRARTRESEREEQEERELDQDLEQELEDLEDADEAAVEDGDQATEPARPAIVVVHDPAPGEDPGHARR